MSSSRRPKHGDPPAALDTNMSADARAVVLLLQARPEMATEIAPVLDAMLGRQAPEEMITVAEFALSIRRHAETVRRYLRSGRITNAEREGDRWMIPRGARVLPSLTDTPVDINRRRRRPQTKTAASEALRQTARAA
jgi:GH24 family phage-related lysozyme (muramidase)